MLRKKEANRGDFAVGLIVVVERLNGNTTLAVTRKLPDVDGRLRVPRNDQLVVRAICFVADAPDLFEDGVGLRDLFFTWVFCTRTG